MSASVVKILRFTPITPTIEGPDTVTRLVFFTDEIPFMARVSLLVPLCIMLPLASGRKVFFTRIGMFFILTGYMVGGYIILAPKLHSSIASLYDSSSMV